MSGYPGGYQVLGQGRLTVGSFKYNVRSVRVSRWSTSIPYLRVVGHLRLIQGEFIGMATTPECFSRALGTKMSLDGAMDEAVVSLASGARYTIILTKFPAIVPRKVDASMEALSDAEQAAAMAVIRKTLGVD